VDVGIDPDALSVPCLSDLEAHPAAVVVVVTVVHHQVEQQVASFPVPHLLPVAGVSAVLDQLPSQEAVVLAVLDPHHDSEVVVVDLASLDASHDLENLIVLSRQIASSYLSSASWFLCLLC
jgi:hypothetical protein